MAYSYVEKMTILNWARANGAVSAARRFGVETSTILRWNREYKVYSPRPQRTFSLEQKIEILNYAQKYSLTHAMQKYNLEIGTMQNWNKTLHIYTSNGRKEKTIYSKHNPRTSDAHKMRVLQYAKIYGPSAASREYGVPKSTIHLWNNRYNVYKTRAFRKFTDEKKQEIIKFAQRGTLSVAARKYQVSIYQIQEWAKAQKQK